MQMLKFLKKSFFRMFQFSPGLSVFFGSIFGFQHDYCQAAGWVPEAVDKSAIGFGAHPIAGIYDFIMQAGQSIAGSNPAPSTLLIVLIVTSILSAFLTYFGILLLRIFKND